jgi:hypothetical protein
MDDRVDERGHEQARVVDSGTAEPAGARWVRSPLTGRLVVAARPDDRKVTSEEIYEYIRAEEICEMMRGLDP